MKFVDQAVITVQAGDGGAGCVSFRRERHVPRGGPDGGDGGRGGDIIFIATRGKRTLSQFRYKKYFTARKGSNGLGKQKIGKKGSSLTIELPLGSIVKNADTEQILKDFVKHDESMVVAQGGMGGRGNMRFKTSTQRVPRFAQPGQSGQLVNLNIELKLIADVGIIGLPNAGKSTLISVMSSARPKVADYPFTTLIPSLGVVQMGWGEPFVMADIPGLIEGAHKGAGLGIKFLRHIERTRILLHLIDVSSIDIDNPLRNYKAIINELAMHSEKLAQKPQIIVLNKLDIPDSENAANVFQEAIEENPPQSPFIKGGNMEEKITLISAATRMGIDDLKTKLVQLLDKTREQ